MSARVLSMNCVQCPCSIPDHALGHNRHLPPLQAKAAVRILPCPSHARPPVHFAFASILVLPNRASRVCNEKVMCAYPAGIDLATGEGVLVCPLRACQCLPWRMKKAAVCGRRTIFAMCRETVVSKCGEVALNVCRSEGRFASDCVLQIARPPLSWHEFTNLNDKCVLLWRRVAIGPGAREEPK